MVKLPAQYPDATWHPIPNYNGWPAPYDVLDALAFVGHSAEGDGDPPPRFYDGKSAGAHFWNKKDGTLYQLSPLDKPAWANGYLDLANGAASPIPLVAYWYKNNLNPNWFTVSMEHEGFAGQALTSAQLANTTKVAAWLEAQGLPLNANNFIPHCDISATACPSNRIPFASILATIHASPSAVANSPNLPPSTAADNSHDWQVLRSLARGSIDPQTGQVVDWHDDAALERTLAALDEGGLGVAAALAQLQMDVALVKKSLGTVADGFAAASASVSKSLGASS